jgi:peptide deformylase
MAVVPIRIVGDPVLHTPTQPVAVGADGSLPEDLPELISTLYETMDAAHGVGLAANQIGHSLRLFVYDCADDRGLPERRRGVVINPVLETSEIPETMPDATADDEGCLSVPGESFPTAARSTSRAPACSRGCCSTRPGTSTGSSTWTGSSAATPAAPNAP